MTDTYKVLTGSIDIYLAAANTAPPAPASNPSGDWTQVAEGLITEDGVTRTDTETKVKVRTLAKTLAVDSRRTEEARTVSFSILDATVDTLAKLRGQTVAKVAATNSVIGTSKMFLTRGVDVEKFALLLRGRSPANVATQAIGDMLYYEPNGEISVGDATDSKNPRSTPVTFEALDAVSGGYIMEKTADTL